MILRAVHIGCRTCCGGPGDSDAAASDSEGSYGHYETSAWTPVRFLWCAQPFVSETAERCACVGEVDTEKHVGPLSTYKHGWLSGISPLKACADLKGNINRLNSSYLIWATEFKAQIFSVVVPLRERVFVFGLSPAPLASGGDGHRRYEQGFSANHERRSVPILHLYI